MSNESSAIDDSGYWSDSCGAVHVLRADIHNVCPKGHKLIVRVAPVTEVPAFCNSCFMHIVQTSWAGDVKFCAVAGCRFIVCASCLISLQSSSENCSYLDACLQRESVSSLKVQFVVTLAWLCQKMVSNVSQGVRISWLRWFRQRWANYYCGWTTEEVVNVIFRPRTFVSRRIFCEELALDGDMQHFVGPANRFVCHSWKSSFSGLIDGLLDSVHENEAILWIDVFSMQLHQLEASKRKDEIYYFDDVKNVMSRMKSFSLFLHPLLNPAVFESRWSVNHQHV